MKINTDPTTLANSFYEMHATLSPDHESDRRLLGDNPERDAWIDVHTNRFTDTDTYRPYDLSKNPSALYAYENGFDIIFPAQTLGELGKTAVVAASGSMINTPAEAEVAISSLDDTDPYKDEARSNLALHYLYAENYEDANRLMHAIGDSAFATHVLAHIVKANDEKGLVSKVEQEELIDQLREQVTALSQVSDAYQTPIVVEAAEAIGDKRMARKARRRQKQALATHMKPVESGTVITKDGTVKVDMSAFFED